MGRTLGRVGIFLSELQRRRVGRVAIAYAAVVFVLLQMGEIVLPAFGAPDWVLRALVVSSFMGFPPALALAWIFDVTSQGIRRTQDASPGETLPLPSASASEHPGAGAEAPGPEEEGPTTLGTSAEEVPHPAGVRRDRLLPRLALVGITAMTVAILGWWLARDSWGREAAAQDGGEPSTTTLPGEATPSGIPEIRSLAVLPLDDFSQEEGGEHFTAAIHEEFVTHLSRLGGIRVLSRTSTTQMDRAGKTLPLIADELGVDAILEGSVFRAGERVRISVQLIHGSSDRHLWAGSYEGTMEDAITLQGEVAEAVAREIQILLFPGEALNPGKVQLAANPEAQEAFLKGRLLQAEATPEALQAAEDHFQEAVARDSGFAPAHAGLAATRFLMRLESSTPQQEDSQDREGVGTSTLRPIPPGNPGASLAAQRAPSLVNRKEASPANQRAPSLMGQEVMEPLARALALDHELPEVRAVLVALREHLDSSETAGLPEEVRVHVLAAGSLGAELALTGTELGRQIQRGLVERGSVRGRDGMGPDRFAGLQRLQAAGDVERTVAVLRELVNEPEAPSHIWEALEEGMARQGDFAGAVEVRRQWLARTDPSPEAQASLQRLELLLEKEREQGYWIWRLGELEARRVRGEAASWVETARAHLALGRKEEALANLREALMLQERALLSLWADPAWDPLRGDPAFREIQHRIARGTPEPRGGSPRP
jgi:TolB-like protein